MESERLIDLVGGRGPASRHSRAKRQQQMMMGSSSSSSSREALELSDMNDSGSGNVNPEGDADIVAVAWSKKKGKAPAMVSSNVKVINLLSDSEDEDPGDGTAIAVTANKRLEKAMEDEEDSVDPTLVPRKLRSATNKRGGQSASPPLSDSKKKRQCVSNGIQVHDIITEDEKEVIQALYALSRMNPCQMNVDKERIVTGDNRNDNNISNSSPKDAIFPLQRDGLPNEEETFMSKGGGREEIIPNSGCKASESNVNEASHLDYFKLALSCKNGSLVDISRGAPTYYSGNRFLLQLTHNAPATALNSGSPGTIATNHDVQPAPEKRELSIVPFGQKEAAPSMATLLNDANDNPKLPLSICPAVDLPGVPATATSDHLPVELPGNPSNAKRRSWGNCATHVYISHLITSYHEKKENQISTPSKLNDFNSEEEVPTLGRKGGGSEMPRMSYEYDMYSQQAPIISEAYDGPTQTRQFLPISTGFEAGNSGNNMRPCGQVGAPFIQSHLSRHPAAPFPFSRVPYTTRYSDQPVQYVGNPLFNGLQTSSSSSDALRLQQRRYQQQQQMYQSQVVPSYRQQMELRMWQDAHMHDPAFSWNLNVQRSSAPAALTPSAGIQHNSGMQLQLLGRSHHYRHPVGARTSVLQQQGPSQLKLMS